MRRNYKGKITIVRALKAARKQIRELVGTKQGHEKEGCPVWYIP